ncbi:MAG: sulfotransferase [Moraxellaceae bacterium]|jgi:hypothetical protein|nr:sulfotransferase [Moraxellaceae bacterium]
MKPPVYLLASERSGTNLLRKRLTENQRAYFGGAPAHFLASLYYREPYYGDLGDDNCFRELIRDALDLCYVHFSPWDVEFTVEEVLADFTASGLRRSSVLLSHFLMQKYAEAKGYESYFCKDNNLYEFVDALLRDIPGVKFIYLHRDPRDYALSQLNRPRVLQDIFRIARLWEYEQNKCIRHLVSLPPERIHRVSYETLIADEERVIQDVCGFLGTALEKKAAVEKDNLKVELHEWKNLDKPTMKDNAGKFRDKMTPRQLAVVESLCWQPMRYLGYEPVHVTRPSVSLLERASVSGFAILRWLLRRFVERKAGTTDERLVKRDRLLRKLEVNYRNSH